MSFVHQTVRISARTDTAAARSASDMAGTRTGSSIVTGVVREPCPPRSPLGHGAINCWRDMPRHPPLRATVRPRPGLINLVGNSDSRPGVPSHEPGQPPIQDPQSQVEGSYAAGLGAPRTWARPSRSRTLVIEATVSLSDLSSSGG